MPDELALASALTERADDGLAKLANPGLIEIQSSALREAQQPLTHFGATKAFPHEGAT